MTNTRIFYYGFRPPFLLFSAGKSDLFLPSFDFRLSRRRSRHSAVLSNQAGEVLRLHFVIGGRNLLLLEESVRDFVCSSFDGSPSRHRQYSSEAKECQNAGRDSKGLWSKGNFTPPSSESCLIHHRLAFRLSSKNQFLRRHLQTSATSSTNLAGQGRGCRILGKMAPIGKADGQLRRQRGIQREIHRRSTHRLAKDKEGLENNSQDSVFVINRLNNWETSADF